MVKHEFRAVASLSLIMAFRMLGLFMILPVFSAYAHHLPGATSLLVGVALGIYGLTQACLQLPFGMLSDKVGRKPIIALGLVLFAIGSIIAALAHSMAGIILGRAIQGAGAIGSTCIALVADLTRDENRSKAMAFIGLSIGTAFTIALILGPIIHSGFGLEGIFWATTLFALMGLVLLFVGIPTPPKLGSHIEDETVGRRFKAILTDPSLIRLDLGVACSHAILTATFIAMPILFTHNLVLSQWQQVWLYLIVLVTSFLAMVPFIIIAEKKRRMKLVFASAVGIMALSQLFLLQFQQHLMVIGATLFVFFTAFTLLEASLPSLVSKFAPIRNKGTATGIYSTAQFLGIFIGGVLGGWVHGQFGLNGIFLFCACIGVIWLVAALTMKQPPYLSTIIIAVPPTFSAGLVEKTQRINGVAEAVWMPDDGLIYLKADRQIVSENELRNWIQTGNLPQP